MKLAACPIDLPHSRYVSSKGLADDEDVAIATDCIDVPSDTRYSLLHCDFNTGLVYMRARPEVIEFTDRWRETIANAKETRIRDQAAFNMMTKLTRPQPVHAHFSRSFCSSVAFFWAFLAWTTAGHSPSSVISGRGRQLLGRDLARLEVLDHQDQEARLNDWGPGMVSTSQGGARDGEVRS